jgi:tetratricopeptide (TPR) repeat protein
LLEPALPQPETAEPLNESPIEPTEQTDSDFDSDSDQNYQRRNAARQRQRQSVLLPLAGAVGAIGLAAITFWTVPQIVSRFQTLVNETTGTSSPTTPQAELAEKSTADLQKLAIDSFAQDRYNRGQQAVETLLDRGAFAEAEAAVASIPADRRNDAKTHFLQGRLAWQAVKQGNSQYSVADARQSWQKAVAADANNPLYHEAIGFADYEAGNPEQAIQSWVRALSLREQPTTREASTAAQPSLSDRVLTSYAGIALALWKTSTNPDTSQPGELLSKAVKTYQMVEVMDSASFQPDALNQNWLWTPTAIRDWQTLSTAAPEANGG